MDAAYLHERAACCRRMAQTLPRDNPARFYLLEIADDLLASALRLRRGLRALGQNMDEQLPDGWFCYPRTLRQLQPQPSSAPRFNAGADS